MTVHDWSKFHREENEQNKSSSTLKSEYFYFCKSERSHLSQWKQTSLFLVDFFLRFEGPTIWRFNFLFSLAVRFVFSFSLYIFRIFSLFQRTRTRNMMLNYRLQLCLAAIVAVVDYFAVAVADAAVDIDFLHAPNLDWCRTIWKRPLESCFSFHLSAIWSRQRLRIVTQIRLMLMQQQKQQQQQQPLMLLSRLIYANSFVGIIYDFSTTKFLHLWKTGFVFHIFSLSDLCAFFSSSVCVRFFISLYKYFWNSVCARTLNALTLSFSSQFCTVYRSPVIGTRHYQLCCFDCVTCTLFLLYLYSTIC